MSRTKLRVAKTEMDNLISNLRGEVGEVITAWILLRHFMIEASRMRSGDPLTDMSDKALCFVNLIADKMRDELVGRLSELAEEKIGQLTFHFATVKLKALEKESKAFTKRIIRERIREKRNYDVSHKVLPEKWADRRHIDIPYRTLISAIASALVLMKKIDRIALGPAAPYLWREQRKRRYQLIYPPKAAYMLVPYLYLSGEDRLRILVQEIKEGISNWSELPTRVDGLPKTVLANKKWGLVKFGQQIIPLRQYPLQELTSLTTD